ncbi:hypothetical protein GCM10012275_49350 [Longimycelium tulufanense]|uniref:Uncharacterized protein n=1 Tax=Longimycelium tulufanense TaxID=907463 RepID=A0A8J3CFV3_9PSEU|nr:hypothetical protein GCM10012275_49350 [Longimycelium tulufanense]
MCEQDDPGRVVRHREVTGELSPTEWALGLDVERHQLAHGTRHLPIYPLATGTRGTLPHTAHPATFDMDIV